MAYRDNDFYIPTLFYADDGLIIANTLKQAEVMIDLAEKCGLRISMEKSNCLIFNCKKNKPTVIKNIKVVNNIKYLGVIISDVRNCFIDYKGE